MNRGKVCSRFIPHFLTTEQKQVRLICTWDFVETADGDPNFLKSVVSGNESWCYMYNLQTKQQSAVWLSLGASRAANVRRQKSKMKSLLITFFNSKSLLHHKFIPLRQMITSTVYLAVMKCLMRHICQVWPEYRKAGCWSLLRDNAPAHTTTIPMRYYAANVLSRPPPYSPNLALANFFLFPKIKLKMKDIFFENIPAIHSTCSTKLKAIP